MSDRTSHFLMALGRIDGGLPVEIADRCLTDVIEAVHRTGKKGSVTVRLEVSPNGELGLATTAKVEAKAPQVQFGQTFFFVDGKGRLTRQAPGMEQMGMFRKEETDG
ncbi:MAG: hypothetical protein Tsb0020_54320 [Haliangiales bacterium]